MYKGLTLALLLPGLLLSAPSARAHDDQRLELTPFIGFRFDGDFEQTDPATGLDTNIKLADKASFGFVVAWPYSNQRQGEFLFSHYETDFESDSSLTTNNDISVTYMQLGGNIPLSQGYVPFWLSGGLGLTYLAPDNSRFDSESQFSINLGLHTKVPLNEQLSLKLGARMFATFFDSESQIFCGNEGCIAHVSSEVWLQGEIAAGLSFSF